MRGSITDRAPTMTGGCQCGAVRYALYAAPKVGICYCRMCQKAVGGPFFAWAMVARADFAWTRGAPALFRSSSAAQRGFCATCGTPLSFQYDARPGSMDVSIGSLDAPGAVHPAVALGAESRVQWCDACLFDGIPQHESGSLDPPTDLGDIENYQHPDADTPGDWLQTRTTMTTAAGFGDPLPSRRPSRRPAEGPVSPAPVPRG